MHPIPAILSLTSVSYTHLDVYKRQILEVLIAQGRALECNTGGYKYGLGEPNPSASVLKRYRELGGELITIGSDAHESRHLGYAFSQANSLLKECGFRYYTVYQNRKPCFYPL